MAYLTADPSVVARQNAIRKYSSFKPGSRIPAGDKSGGWTSAYAERQRALGANADPNYVRELESRFALEQVRKQEQAMKEAGDLARSRFESQEESMYQNAEKARRSDYDAKRMAELDNRTSGIVGSRKFGSAREKADFMKNARSQAEASMSDYAPYVASERQARVFEYSDDPSETQKLSDLREKAKAMATDHYRMRQSEAQNKAYQRDAVLGGGGRPGDGGAGWSGAGVSKIDKMMKKAPLNIFKANAKDYYESAQGSLQLKFNPDAVKDKERIEALTEETYQGPEYAGKLMDERMRLETAAQRAAATARLLNPTGGISSAPGNTTSPASISTSPNTVSSSSPVLPATANPRSPSTPSMPRPTPTPIRTNDPVPAKWATLDFFLGRSGIGAQGRRELAGARAYAGPVKTGAVR